jgi:hypothetical protein
MVYYLGILYNKNDKRIENNSRVKLVMDYLQQSNSLNSIILTYFDISENFDFILHTNYIKVWISANNDITQLIDLYFGNNPQTILIAICDDKFTQKDYTNIIHVNNSDIGQMLQLLNIVFAYINKYDEDAAITNLYVFFDNDNISYEKYFRLNENKYNNNFLPITYCNTDNAIEYGSIISQISMHISEGIITNINTLFIYLTRDFSVFFKIYTTVENPLSIQSDVNLTSRVRHICSANSYLNSGYIAIYNLMKEYLLPKEPDFLDNFCKTESELNIFFNKSLRMTVFAPILSRYEIDKYNYLNYVLYIKNPVSSIFLENNRITIYTILLEKALKLGSWLLYRNISDLNSLRTKGILIDGKLFGPPNYIITKNNIDDYWYNRIPYYTFEPNILYYITDFVNKTIFNVKQSALMNKNTNFIQGGIYIYVEPEEISISLAEGVSSIAGSNFNIDE